MLKQAHQRGGTDSNLPIIKRNKLKLKAFWLRDSMESCTLTGCLVFTSSNWHGSNGGSVSEWMRLKITGKHRTKGNELSIYDAFCQSKYIRICHIISTAFIINFEILSPFPIYNYGSSSHAASGKVFFPIASHDGEFLNPDKNVIRMRSHKSQVKCFINLPTKYWKLFISNF